MRSLGGLAVAGLAMTCVLASLLGFDGRVRLGGHLADSNSFPTPSILCFHVQPCGSRRFSGHQGLATPAYCELSATLF